MDEELLKHIKAFLPLVLAIVIVLTLAAFRLILPLLILLILVCVLLVISILIQAHRGGGLVTTLGGMGLESAIGSSATPVKKFTAGVAVVFLVIVLALDKAYRYRSVVEETARPAATKTEPQPQKPQQQRKQAQPEKKQTDAKKPKKETE